MKKNKLFLLSVLVFLFTKSFCQDGGISTIYTPDSVKHTEQTYIYPGGQDGLLKDIANNFIVPKTAKKDNIQGKIFLQITVDTLGNANGKVLKGLREDVDNAAIEMTKKLKPFTPARMDNKKVPTTLNVPLKLQSKISA